MSAPPPPVFDEGTLFEGYAVHPDGDMLWMSFSVTNASNGTTPTAKAVTPLEIAEALSIIAEAKGHPPIEFLGRPVRVPLNPQQEGQ